MKNSSFSLRPHPRLVLLIGLLLVAILAFIGYNYLNQSVTLTADDQQSIKNVTLTAFGAVDELVVIPHASPDLHKKLAATDIAAARMHAHDVFSVIYAPDCAICKNIETSIDQTITGQADDQYRALDGGVRNPVWRQISPAANGTVTVILAATAWSKVTFPGKTATPTGPLVMQYTLIKSGTHWLITNQVQLSARA